MEHSIAGEHGALGKSTNHRLLVVKRELLWEFFEKGEYALSRQGQALWNLHGQITNTTCLSISLDTRKVDDPPSPRVAEPHIEREGSFRKEPASPTGNVDHICQRN